MSDQLSRESGGRPLSEMTVDVVVNGSMLERPAEASTSLLDFLRDEGFTSVHAGCEHGVCGACTVLVDGLPVRSCILLAAQAGGSEVETVEGLGTPEDPHPLQLSFSRCAGLQCGFCTPGFLMLGTALLRSDPAPSREAMRDAASSNICRCTGYDSIVDAIEDGAAALRAARPSSSPSSIERS